jgi:hypothetical protein
MKYKCAARPSLTSNLEDEPGGCLTRKLSVRLQSRILYLGTTMQLKSLAVAAVGVLTVVGAAPSLKLSAQDVVGQIEDITDLSDKTNDVLKGVDKDNVESIGRVRTSFVSVKCREDEAEPCHRKPWGTWQRLPRWD